MFCFCSSLISVVDTNDRFLRKITVGQANTEKGFVRQVGKGMNKSHSGQILHLRLRELLQLFQHTLNCNDDVCCCYIGETNHVNEQLNLNFQKQKPMHILQCIKST